jgi:hypothetical protein
MLTECEIVVDETLVFTARRTSQANEPDDRYFASLPLENNIYILMRMGINYN